MTQFRRNIQWGVGAVDNKKLTMAALDWAFQ